MSNLQFFKNLNNSKIPSSEIHYLSNEDLANTQDTFTLNLQLYNLVVLDVDDAVSRDLILKMHLDNQLIDYTYSIDVNTGSAHFYFLKDEKACKNKKNKSIYYNIFNCPLEYLDDKVTCIKPTYTYVNFDKLFDKSVNSLATASFFMQLVAYGKNATLLKNAYPYTINDKIVDTIAKLKNAMHKDGTQRGKTMLKLAMLLLNKKYIEEDIDAILTFIDKYWLGDSLSSTKDSLNDILTAYKQYQAKEDVEENPILDEHLSFVTVDKKKHYKIDLYYFSLYLINKYKLRTRDWNIYGMFNNHFIRFPYLEKNKDDILYLIVSNIYEHYNATFNFKIPDYKNIIDIILAAAPALKDEDLDDMNISLANGTLIYDKKLKKYHFSKEIIPHIVAFNHIAYLDETSSDFDKTLYQDRKQIIDNYLASLVDADAIDCLWQMIATTFLYNTYHRKAFILTGSGRNGKSTFISFIQMINKDNFSNISLKDINSQFMGHKLNNNTLNTCSEMDKEIAGTDSILKSIIAGDRVSMDVKNDKMGIDFVNKSTLIFATNNDLIISDYTTAFLDRLLFIDFNKSFENKNIEDFLDKILIDKYSYYYIIKRCVKEIEKLDANNWKINSKYDKEQQMRFKHSNSLVYKYFAYSNYIDENDNFTPEAIILFKKYNCVELYNLFVKGVKQLFNNDYLTAYGLHKFLQQAKDVLKLKIVIINNKEYFKCLKPIDIALYDQIDLAQVETIKEF